ncbi:MAG: hypothetical protein M3364_06495 [Actinomycetota bacterium]|nr:hypothetical protein [Actinomycetota bacterium]
MTLQIVQIVLAIGIVAAFASLQFGLLTPRDPRYLVTNLVSSLGLAVTAILTVQLGFVITNGLWVLVSAAGLLALLRDRHRPTTRNT